MSRDNPPEFTAHAPWEGAAFCDNCGVALPAGHLSQIRQAPSGWMPIFVTIAAIRCTSSRRRRGVRQDPAAERRLDLGLPAGHAGPDAETG